MNVATNTASPVSMFDTPFKKSLSRANIYMNLPDVDETPWNERFRFT